MGDVDGVDWNFGVGGVGPKSFGVGNVGPNLGVGQKSSMGKCLAIQS